MSDKGNTVGNSNVHFWDLYPDAEAAYILGLWMADGYQRTSSIGITNVDERIVERFRDFLLQNFPFERLRMRIYHPIGLELGSIFGIKLAPKVSMYPMLKCKQPAY